MVRWMCAHWSVGPATKGSGSRENHINGKAAPFGHQTQVIRNTLSNRLDKARQLRAWPDVCSTQVPLHHTFPFGKVRLPLPGAKHSTIGSSFSSTRSIEELSTILREI